MSGYRGLIPVRVDFHHRVSIVALSPDFNMKPIARRGIAAQHDDGMRGIGPRVGKTVEFPVPGNPCLRVGRPAVVTIRAGIAGVAVRRVHFRPDRKGRHPVGQVRIFAFEHDRAPSMPQSVAMDLEMLCARWQLYAVNALQIVHWLG